MLIVSDLSRRCILEICRFHSIDVDDIHERNVGINGSDYSVMRGGKDICIKRDKEEAEEPADNCADAVNRGIGAEGFYFIEHSA